MRLSKAARPSPHRAARAARTGRPRANQEGYALLMAIFLVATMIVLATVVTPSVLTQGQREREQESIWRGNQYVRAIELYYRKNGRYPQTPDDLIKGNLGVHFLRKAYKDPINSEDGSWRFIYVSGSGQLIGSVRYHSLQEMALTLKMPGAGQALPGAAGQQGATQQTPAPPGAGQQAGQQGAGQPGTGQQTTGAANQQGTGQTGTGQTDTGQQSATGTADQQAPPPPAATTAQGFAPTQGAFTSSFGSTQSTFGSAQPTSVPLQAVDGPVLGATLIGVAGKLKKPSLIVYQGGKTYFEWEFIYNPLSVVAVGGQPAPGALPGGIGTPTAAPGGVNGAGTSGFAAPGAGGNAPMGLPPITTTPQR